MPELWNIRGNAGIAQKGTGITAEANNFHFRRALRSTTSFLEFAAPGDMRCTSRSGYSSPVGGASPHGGSSPRGRPLEVAAVSSTRKAFRRLLLVKHGSMVRAWKSLDTNGHGRVSFFHFTRVARDLGNVYDVQNLWEMIDSDQDGFVTLGEIDPDLALLLGDFSNHISGACGSASAAWRRHFGKSQYGRCSQRAFEKGAGELGYGGDAYAVFHALDIDKTGVSFKDFQMLDKWFKVAPPGSWEYCTLRPTRSVVDLRLTA